MGIPLVCERWLTLPSNPDIVGVEELYASAGAGATRGASSASRRKIIDAETLGRVARARRKMPDKGTL